ncbi:hypothetical protein LGH70_23330 [Hymenobacter sp. BT635]|uniref:Uncharacterized protein n=1 Tax=Hymenobacter nitidus TaxID=2880929 RepID=A0ABS8AJC6_9BACT|nr:hypothetical protein [Hymenobacter nitidus]MCB2380546.1 hypothetical protein [Hymenobacter nitidus]
MTLGRATQRTFYRLRRTLVVLGVARADVVPRAPLQPWFPWRQRPQRWRRWQEQSGLLLPALRVPAPVFAALWAGSTAGLWSVAPAWGLAVIAGLAAAVVLAQLPLVRRGLPAATIGELTVRLVGAHYRVLSHPYVRNNLPEERDVVLAGLARCGVERTAIDPDELRDGTEVAWQ